MEKKERVGGLDENENVHSLMSVDIVFYDSSVIFSLLNEYLLAF